MKKLFEWRQLGINVPQCDFLTKHCFCTGKITKTTLWNLGLISVFKPPCTKPRARGKMESTCPRAHKSEDGTQELRSGVCILPQCTTRLRLATSQGWKVFPSGRFWGSNGRYFIFLLHVCLLYWQLPLMACPLWH